MKRRNFLLTAAVLFHLTSPWLPTPAFAELDWIIQTVDSEGDVGWCTSLQLDVVGNPHISYYDSTNRGLKYAAYNGSAWNMETVEASDPSDPTGFIGLSNSLALDAYGNPHISYCALDPASPANTRVGYATFDGSTWNIQRVGSGHERVGHTSLALDASGNPHICFITGLHRALKYTCFNGSSWNTEVVDADIGIKLVDWASLALDAVGNPHISYHIKHTGELRYATFDGADWDIQRVDPEGSVGEWASIAVDSDGNPHISYYDASNACLKYATFDGSIWDIRVVDSDLHGEYISLALDGDENPHISYYDDTNSGLKYATFNDSSWYVQTVDSQGDVGWYTSLALDAFGNPHISYYDYVNQDLKYAYVPEPATLLLVGLGAVVVRRRSALAKT